MSAVAVLAVRELRGVARSRSQLYSSMLFPLMLLAVLGTGVSNGLNPASPLIAGSDYTSFLAPGMVAMTALFASTFSSASFYRDRESGVLRALFASPQPAAAILLGKTFGAVAIGAIQALLVLALVAAIPGIDLAWQFGWLGGAAAAAAAVVALNLALNGFALLIAVRVRTMQGFHLIMNLALFPLFFLSGAFFPIHDAPAWLEVVHHANPLTYFVDLLQYAAYAPDGEHLIGPALSAPVAAAIAAILLAAGLRRAPAA